MFQKLKGVYRDRGLNINANETKFIIVDNTIQKKTLVSLEEILFTKYISTSTSEYLWLRKEQVNRKFPREYNGIQS